ncbi:Uncharacterised protein [Yersinia rohdei]|uniref:Uncharacterized protein n=1 Tax=Yersinia rohdei TaxID=29485 RepID=A0A0U1HPG1_YERRO|nr:Uncharacterised protein [Yersinia rohdei]
MGALATYAATTYLAPFPANQLCQPSGLLIFARSDNELKKNDARMNG